ncbi:hypothetical protein Rhal01_03505 [Rubritalea halochordaticola]|uniref:Ankyrin repeat domain-containing protein n=1 Tax=Rubritalea halochordaticola TaxID=714537 RepID=A0ABP9V7H2_9BACT
MNDEDKRYAELQEMALDAARHGDIEMLKPMLEAGMPVNLQDHKGNSLLMLASYNDQPQTVQILLYHGADPGLRNSRGQTPLAGVAFKGHLECARILINHGADPNAEQGHGQTPITFAAMFGRQEVLALLQQNAGKSRASSLVLSSVAGITRRLRTAATYAMAFFKNHTPKSHYHFTPQP